MTLRIYVANIFKAMSISKQGLKENFLIMYLRKPISHSGRRKGGNCEHCNSKRVGALRHSCALCVVCHLGRQAGVASGSGRRPPATHEARGSEALRHRQGRDLESFPCDTSQLSI